MLKENFDYSKFKNLKYISKIIFFFGVCLSALLIISSVVFAKKEFSYYNFLMVEYLFDAGIFIIIECFIGSVLFEYFIGKEND